MDIFLNDSLIEECICICHGKTFQPHVLLHDRLTTDPESVRGHVITFNMFVSNFSSCYADMESNRFSDQALSPFS